MNIKRTISLALSSVMAFSMMAIGGATTAFAAPTMEVGATYRFINSADTSNRALNVYSVNSGTAPSLSNVCLYTSSASDSEQQWVLKQSGGNYYLAPKSNSAVAIDVYTGTVSGQKNINAHVYAPSSSSYITFENSSKGADYVKIRSTYSATNTKYLTANQNSNGTASGRTANDAGNVYWYGSLTDGSQDWKVIKVGEDPSGGVGNGTIVQGSRPSTLNYNSTAYSASFNRFHQNYTAGNGTAQCTWHAYGRAYEVLGKTITFSGTGGLHGGTWYNRITNGTKTQVPTANSVAVWQYGAYGHVAYVEKVVGNDVFISEANWAGTLNVLDAADGKVVIKDKNNMNRTTSAGETYTFVGYVSLQ